MPDELDFYGPVSRAYTELVSSGNFDNDPAQLKLAGLLDQLLRDIADRRLSSKSSSLGWLFGKKAEENPKKYGLYIWGGVGRGKSVLMDMFYSAADITPKRRVHFNDFMQEAHQLIHDQRQKSGKTKEKDPVIPVGRLLAEKSKLLCFDEFSVTDIADAMLLGRLFSVLFAEGTVIVTTSNVKPENLYFEGLNRQLFLPFISLLQSKMSVHELVSPTDYRMAKLPIETLYTWPLSKAAAKTMSDSWNALTDDAAAIPETVQLKGRTIEVARAAHGVAWFHFDQLCREARGAADYLAIARQYSTLMIEQVPILSASERNEAKRFITLIDILYDNNNKLVISAEGPPDALYQVKSGGEAFEFARTASRLVEMQSREYNQARSGRN